jgi:hypothetical protein
MSITTHLGGFYNGNRWAGICPTEAMGKLGFLWGMCIYVLDYACFSLGGSGPLRRKEYGGLELVYACLSLFEIVCACLSLFMLVLGVPTPYDGRSMFLCAFQCILRVFCAFFFAC